MGLQFYIGSSGAGKSEQLYQDIIEQSMQEPNTQFLIIVPDQFTMQTQKELVMKHKRGGIMNIDVLSFGRLTHRIFEETGGNQNPVLDDTGKSLVLRKIAAERASELSAIGSNLRKIGYIHEVKSAISEFMQYGIDGEQLKQLVEYAKSRGTLYYKLKDLELLYQEFEKRIRGKFVTTEGSLGLLAGALEKSALIRDSVVAFDGFTGFTPVQNQVILKIMKLAREVKVAILMEGEENPHVKDGEQKLFALSKKTIRSLEQLAEEAGIKRQKDVILKGHPVYRFRKNPSLAHLEQELFRFHKAVYEENQDSVHIIEASNPVEEVRQTCLAIRKLIREEGYQYRDIAVVAGNLETYADQVEAEFERFSIPCYLDMTRGVTLNPFTEYLRSVLQIFIRDFSYDAVFHFLRSGLSGILEEETDRLENYVLELGIRGKSAWTKNFVRKSLDENDAEKLEELNAIRKKLVEILEPLFESGKTAIDYVNHLYQFSITNKVAEKLTAFEKEFEKAGDLSKAREYGQIYRLVMEVLEQMYDLIGEEELTLQEFAEILDAGFGEIQVGTIPQNVDRIVVGDMERTRLKEVKALFFLGVNDGNIPKSAGTGGIISDIDREFLADGNFEMSPTPRQQMYIQRLYLYMNMTKPEEKLFLSYAHVDGEGKSLRPSYLITTVRKLYQNLSNEMPEKRPGEEQVEVSEDGFEMLAEEMRFFAAGRTEREPLFFTLYKTFEEREDYCERVKNLIQAAFYHEDNLPLGRTLAQALYGEMLNSSVSRLEKYASCAYSYFLQYGLSLKERQEYGFEEVDMGTVFHGVLERFSGKLEAENLTWFDFSEEQSERFIEDAVEQFGMEYGGNVLFSSARNAYAMTRMKRILNRTVVTLQKQLKKGSFQPEKFELSFSVQSEPESPAVSLTDEEKVRLLGRIDRVDTCEKENDIYVKVIDYKSGNKSLDIAAVYYGLQLQLVVYMDAAMKMIQKENPTKNVVPAALLYYHVADPIIKVEDAEITDEIIHQKLSEELRMTGFVNDKDSVVALLDKEFGTKSDVIPIERKKDGSYTVASSVLEENQLLTVSNYVNHKIRKLGKQIMDGNIEKNPYEYKQESSCTYCSFKGVCGFRPDISGCEGRVLMPMKTEEVLNKMKGAKESDGVSDERSKESN